MINDNGDIFCWCGVLTDKSERCARHKNQAKPVRRIKQEAYSGDSSFRELHGYYQAKQGR